MARSLKIGLISNPLSRANRKSGGLAAQVQLTDDLYLAQPRDHDQLIAELIRFAREGVELIAVDGGDGTMRDILSNIDQAYPADWPMFALLPSGKTNVIAGDVGHLGAGRKGFDRLLQARDAGTLAAKSTKCPTVEVSWPDRDVPMKRGFLLGFAAFSDGVAMANESIHSIGINKGLAVFMSIAGVLRRSLMGETKNNKPAGEAGKVFVDGVPIPTDQHFLVVVSTLNRLTLGLRPFWASGDGPLNWLDISAPPKRGVLGVLLMALGKRKSWMEEGGYASGRAQTMDMHFEQPFVLDGEHYEPHGHIKVSASQSIRFVNP